MADEQAAKRYAQAALELGVEGENLAQWRGDLADIALVLGDSQAAPYFADTRVPLGQRLASVDRVLDIGQLPRNFAKVLISHGRSRQARAVERAFTELADAHEGIVHASIVTAVQLPPDQVAGIAERLSQALGKRVRTTATVDPRIVGGIVIRVGDKLVDGSLRSRLKRLRAELAGAR